MRGKVAILALLAASCSPDGSAETSTTSGQTTTSTLATSITTTSMPPSTSTSSAETTTTLDSTTTSVLAGNWASQPVVVAGFGALGWWDGSSWVQVDELTELPVQGGEDYQVAFLGLTAVTTGGEETLLCEPLLNVGVELADEDLLGEWPGPYGVAISAPWNITPHLVESFQDDGTYAGFAATLLSERGLDVASPKIKQLIRVDLEGDGVNEVIVVAEDIVGGFLPVEGDYSIAFMRKVVDGEVTTSILGESVVVEVEGAFLVGFSIGSIADLNGDGQMEVVVDAAYFEGLGVEVWEYIDDDLGILPAIQTGCGV